MIKVTRIGAGQSGYAEYLIDWDGDVWYYSLSPFHNEKALYAYKQHKSVQKWANDIKQRAEVARPHNKESAMRTRSRFPVAEGLINRFLKENGEDPEKDETGDDMPKKDENGNDIVSTDDDDEPMETDDVPTESRRLRYR